MSGSPSTTHLGGSALDRATIEDDTRDDDDDNHRILHTTDISSQTIPAAGGTLSKKSQLKHKVGEILHLHPSSTVVTKSVSGVTLAPSPNPVETTHRLDNHPPQDGLDGLKDVLRKPIKTIKAKAERRTNRELARNLATTEVSHAHDVELIMAQDQIATATTEEERSSAQQRLEALKKARQDMFVRWTLDRHVMKIRQLERKPIQPRERTDFITKAAPKQGQMDWKAYSNHLAVLYSEKYGGQYIGSFAEPPPASQETLSASVERLLVASTPWQEVIMRIRRIYRWENTSETMTYLVAFLVLWAMNLVASAILLAIVVQVLRRRLHTPTVEQLREKSMRIEDPLVSALSLTEQIEKRGEHRWIEPLIEEIGPWLLLQLGDLANLLEVILNFYEWRAPRHCAITLSTLAIGCLAFCLTPSWLLVKVITLNAGLVFFGLFPIGSRYPDYRLLASPAKWLFWNIPNHAEWAIARLQVEGSRQEALDVHQRKGIDTEPKADSQRSGENSSHNLQETSKPPSDQHRSPRIASEVDPKADTADQNTRVQGHASYGCTSEKHSGKLFVTSHGINFKPAVGARDAWELTYDNMYRVEKTNPLVKLGSGQDLLFIDGDGQSFLTSNVTDRDEVFTQIIGYSKVRWQVVG